MTKTSAEPAEPFVKPAPKRLAMLAAEMRGWAYEDIYSALIACHDAGWGDEQIYRETFRLLLLEDSGPADLRVMARDWTKRLPQGEGPAKSDEPGQSTWERGAARARHQLAHRHDDNGQDAA